MVIKFLERWQHENIKINNFWAKIDNNDWPKIIKIRII